MSIRIGHTPRPSRVITTEFAQRQGGFILLKFALLLVPLLLMVGFSVDVGYWYNRTAAIQKAADAAALAGVVWLPDLEKAEQYALEAAGRNGFIDGVDGITVEVSQVQGNENRLRVQINDPSVGSYFYEALSGRRIPIGRDSLAEYVEPVPLGSPRNFFGTGTLLEGDPTFGGAEYLYQSVNPACTNKINGDRHQSLDFDRGSVSLGTCPTSTPPPNIEYRERGYELYIEAKAGRSSNIDVMLYDPRYNEDPTPNGPETCTPTYGGTGSVWVTLGSSGSGGSGTITITGPKQYQVDTNTGSSSVTWGSLITLETGQQTTYSYTNNRRFRYREPTGQTCTTPNEPAIDDFRLNGAEDYTFTLYSADSTPLDDTDNPIVTGCQQVYSENTAFDPAFAGYLGSVRWNRLCEITTGMPDGKYILRVQNSGLGGTTADGSNQWGLVAKYQGATGNALCDGRNDNMCPRVYGKDAISVRAAANTPTAEFFLSEIAAVHVGKTLEIELYDPGEGGNWIEILRPTGTNSWTQANFSWQSFNDTVEGGGNHQSGANVSQISVAGNVFNGRRLRIRINLTGYAPPSDNNWWKIRYNFSGTVTDRTTWSAKVVGDPVHLVEEEAP